MIPATLLASPETRLRARALVVGSLGLAGLSLVLAVVRLSTAPFDLNMAVGLATIVVLVLLPALQYRTRSYRLPATVVTVLLLITLPGYQWTLGAFPAPALLLYPPVPLIAAFFLGRVAGVISALIMSAATLALGATLPTMDPTQLAALSYTFVANAAVATLMSAHLAWAYEGASQRSEAGLREVNAELEAARQAAEAASRSKTEFLRHISHELRTPLNTIIGHGELLRDELAEHGHPDLVADVVRIHEASEHMLALIKELLDISRIEAGLVELTITPVDLAELVTGVAEAMRPLMTAQDNRLTLAIAPGLAPVPTDARRLRQVLLNLLGNACKFTERGEVTLGVEAGAAGEVHVYVRDTGIGMTPAQLARIFQPYVQVDALLERRERGTGLGLAISRRLVEMLGGTIAVSSEPGRGSEFRLTLGPGTSGIVSGLVRRPRTIPRV